jgi:hypothetical protein
VAGVQWEMMEAGKLGEQLNPWGSQLFQTLRTVDPKTTAEQSAFDAWLSQTSDRESARNDRIHGAVGVIPTPLWIVLFFISGLIFVYMLFFADKGERAVVQALLMGTVVAVITAMLLLLYALEIHSTKESAVSVRLRWSAPYRSSTRRSRSRAITRPLRATLAETRHRSANLNELWLAAGSMNTEYPQDRRSYDKIRSVPDTSVH